MLGFLVSKGVISISIYPRCSMYGIFIYIYPQNYPNVNNRPYIEHLGIYIYIVFFLFLWRVGFVQLGWTGEYSASNL